MKEEKTAAFRVDITSGVAESLIDGAKSFLGKILSPGASELGGIISDQIRGYRFTKQVNVLVEAKRKCEENGISPKAISLKLLCPLLEYASLEEDPLLEAHWSTLLANLVDSEKNIDNHVFPYIMSQISLNEYKLITSGFNVISDSMLRNEGNLTMLLYDQPEGMASWVAFVSDRAEIFIGWSNILPTRIELENLVRLGLLEHVFDRALIDEMPAMQAAVNMRLADSGGKFIELGQQGAVFKQTTLGYKFIEATNS